MRLRFWIGLLCVLLIAAGSVTAAILVRNNETGSFERMQKDEAVRAAHQAESMARLAVGQLASAAAFFQVEGNISRHEFGVVSRALLKQRVLNAAVLLDRVPAAQRAAYEALHGFAITERAGQPGQGQIRRAAEHAVYYPVTDIAAKSPLAKEALGFDVGAESERAPYLERARDTGRPVATPVIKLLLGGPGINIYQAIYRDGAPVATVAERRRALIGFAAGTLRVVDLASTVDQALPEKTVEQLDVNGRPISGPAAELEDPATAPVRIANRQWLLVVRDPNRPDISLPLLLAAIGVAISSLLGALILIWSRNEQVQRLEREAGEDALTGLKNRRRFEEEVGAAMARRRRDGGTGALLMIDLDHFKEVNDTHGHPAGDRLIGEVAGVLRRRARRGDIVARLGGDEFAVVLPHSAPAEALLVAEALVAAIRRHDPTLDGVDPVTASIGVAIFGDDPRMSYATLLSEADTAMYAAKDGGRDGVRVFFSEAIRADAHGSI
ncbi:MAG TPA: diguanylate cyclase [Solirubrobacterales bacterium]|jgi:diguanylate cyclase (GGDEF)-like protein